jgi:hypothetical protein
VEDEADRVVEPLLRHEAAMATLVGQHPNASPGQTCGVHDGTRANA